MQPYTLRPALAFAALSTMALLAGCQSYRSSPLDAEAHRGAWHARSAADESVAAFAMHLNKTDPEKPVVYDPDDGVSLAEGELIALVYNPDLRLARMKAGVALARADHAGRWDDPQLGMDLLRITESVSDPWVLTAGLAITLPISGRLEVEKSHADAAYRAELLRVAEAEWRVRHEVRLAWLDWSAARAKLLQHERLIETIFALAQTTSRLADAGELPRTEAGLFAIERARREQERRRLLGQAEVLEQRLRSLMGLSPRAPLQMNPLAVLPAFDEGQAGARSPENNPALVRLCQEYEVAEEALHLEVRRQYPDLTIGPMLESDQGQSRIGLSGGIPLPILNANKQGIAQAHASRELARVAYESEYERLVGLFAQSLATAKALSQERELLADELVPLVDEQVAAARKLLDLGEGGGLVLLESLARAHETKLLLIDVRFDQAKAHAELRYLVGPTDQAEPDREVDQSYLNPPPARTAEEVSP